MKAVSSVFLALVLIVLPLGARAKDPSTFDVWVRGDIAIDPAGKVTSLKWRNADKDARLIAFVDPIAQKWEFEPARINNAAVASESVLTVRLAGELDSKKNVTLRIAEATTGISGVSIVPPSYPRDAIEDGVNAEVSMVLAVNAQGRVESIESVQFEGSAAGRFQRQFEQVARKAAERWRFLPERVAGQPIASKVRMPVTFCLSESNWCAKRAKANPRLEGEPIALNSAVRLKTPLSVAPGG